MPQLKDCSEQQQYRLRCESETEAVRFADTETEGGQVRVRIKLMSVKSKDTAKIRFHNLFEGQVRALWMDFDGNEVSLQKICSFLQIRSCRQAASAC